jgi:hypothetical protein
LSRGTRTMDHRSNWINLQSQNRTTQNESNLL